MKKLQAKLKFDYKRLGTVSQAKQLSHVSWLTAYREIFEPGRHDMSAEGCLFTIRGLTGYGWRRTKNTLSE